METIGQRLKYFLHQEKISVAEMSEVTGIPIPSIYRIFKSQSGLNSTTLTSILDLFPNLNINWLLTGIGTYKNELGREIVQEEQETYGNSSNLKSKVKEILNNEVILETFVEILKKYGK